MKINKRRGKLIIVRSVFNFIIITSGVFFLASFGPFIQYELAFQVRELAGHKMVINTKAPTSQPVALDGILGPSTEELKPASTDFGIVIPKIWVNEKIIDNVNPNDNAQIENALHTGVGHAKGTAYPGQQGNVYLFAHSSLNVWDIPRYNAVFTLLRDLNQGDLIVIFYQGRRYNYVIYQKKTVSPTDTTDLTAYAPQPTLTLQTCDPPGINLNRLIIKAHLVSIGK